MSKDTDEIKTYLKELENRIKALEARPPKNKKGQRGGEYLKTGKSKELRGDILKKRVSAKGEARRLRNHKRRRDKSARGRLKRRV